MFNKAFLAATLAALALAPATAQAHNSSWFWSPALAESRVLMWYDQNWDVGAYDATCLGFGKRIRNDAVSSGRNKWLYRHFDCIVELDDGTSDEDTLHVTGRRGFKLYE